MKKLIFVLLFLSFSVNAELAESQDASRPVSISYQWITRSDDWGWCGMFGIWDAASGGNLWLYSGLDNPMNITNGMTNVQFAAGALQYTEDD